MHTLVLRNRYLLLLVSLLLFFILNPMMVDSEMDRYVFGLLFATLLLFSVYVIGKNRRLIFSMSSLAVLVFVGHWLVVALNGQQEILLLDYGITFTFFLLVTGIVIAYVLRESVITTSTLYGAICGYLLLGLTWSFLYLIILSIQPEAFHLPAHTAFNNLELRSQVFRYFSFVTLTTLGYGDITPISSIARTFAWLEAATGQIYLTIWIAQLVGRYLSHSKKVESTNE